MRVAVIIPTTDGPAPILKLTRLVQAPRSVLRTQDDYRPLRPSSRYHAFIQPGGPLAEQIGIGDGQYELRLGAPVETGRSWELPVALAHWMQRCGHHIDPERPELVVWATGALDNDLSVLSQDYHLPTKLERSAALLQSWLDRGVPVLLLLPEKVTRPPSLRNPRVTERTVRDLSDAIAVIAAMQPDTPHNVPVISAPQSARHQQLLIAGTAVLLVSALFWLTAGLLPTGTANDLEVIDAGMAAAPGIVDEARASPVEGATADPALDPAPVRPAGPPRRSTSDASARKDLADTVVSPAAPVFPVIAFEQAPNGARCSSVIFGDAAPERVELIAVEGAFHAIAEADLCGLMFHLPDTASQAADITLPSVITDLILPSDRQVRFALVPGEDRLFRLRASLPQRIEADVELTHSGHDPVALRVIIERWR